MFGEQGHRLGGGAYDRAPDPNAFENQGLSCEAIIQNRGLLGGGLCCLLTVGLITVMSLGAVEPLYVGIRYNSFNKVADTSMIYEPGRHIIGPFNKFLIFPASVQTLEFTDEQQLRPQGVRFEKLHTQDKDGLKVELHVSLQYKLIKEEIGKLYTEYNMNYDTVVTNTVRRMLSEAATKYGATQLWKDRMEFGNTMKHMVDMELKKKVYSECWGLQLIRIDLPEAFDKRIVETQKQEQEMLIKEQEQQAQVIRAETDVIAATFDRKVKVLMSQGQANYTLTTKEAQATAIQRKIAVESEVMGHIKTELGLMPDGLVLYQKYTAMDDLGDANLVYGFAGSQQVLLGGGK